MRGVSRGCEHETYFAFQVHVLSVCAFSFYYNKIPLLLSDRTVYLKIQNVTISAQLQQQLNKACIYEGPSHTRYLLQIS